MLEHVPMTENWSRPWHSLQRALAGEFTAKFGRDAVHGEGPIDSWLTRALGETSASAFDRQ